MAQKPSIPKGTRDFAPAEVAKRNYIIDIIKKQFKCFGFQPIETPSFENSETLMGKYGEEGDRLIFKILNSGEFIKNFNETLISTIKTALYYHYDAVKDSIANPDFVLTDYKLNFFLGFKEYLLKKNSTLFNDEKLNVDHLIKDLWFLLIEHTVNTDEKQSQFVSVDKENLNNYVVRIFGDFYFYLESKYLANYVSEKALRYDLTVPFARYVVMHQNELDFPFKRYQIQPVWRADRPQKGRFREFYQCDADVVGSDSLLQEVEFIQLYDAVFTELGLTGTTIKLNNRKVLAGIAETIGAQELLVDFTVALDKLDKIGEARVREEMGSKGISQEAVAKAAPLFALTGGNAEQLKLLADFLSASEIGTTGVSELQFLLEAISGLGLQSAQLQIDVTLARGLNYYTGAIFEVAAPKGVTMGSIGGGGRYDDLTGIFGLQDVSGVGISFGLDRIYLVMEELGLFPETIDRSLDVLCLNFGPKEGMAALGLATSLRKQGIKADVYPSDAKLNKQFKYANNRKVPYVILLGGEELENNTFIVKNMATGNQASYPMTAVADFIATL